MYFLLLAVYTLFCTSSCDRPQNQDYEVSSLLPPRILLGPVLIASPPRNYALGISLVIALNIRGEPSKRLSSVISQELLNPEIDGLRAYWVVLLILSVSVIKVTQELNDLVNKTNLITEDLQRLINVSSCSHSSVSISVDLIPILWSRLHSLYWSNPRVRLNEGCKSQETSSTTESTINLTTGTESKNHELSRKHEKARHHVQDYLDPHLKSDNARNSNNHERKVYEDRHNHKREQ